MNCTALNESLLDDELFGHEPGSFTGADRLRKGRFEHAHGGTLFLDEIGDLPLYQQVKLLRVLEQNTVTRLGSTAEVPVDFRLVAATNKDLRMLVGQGEFRADLYYRLAVIELRIPNLEQRGPHEKAAIFRALLLSQGVQDEPPPWLLDRVARTRYEGNVRELSNVAERVAIVRRQFQAWDQPRIERIFDQLAEPLRPSGPPAVRVDPASFTDAERAERERVLAALEANGWRRQDTAHTLGISRKVLWEKMRKYQILDGEPGIPEDA
jgi:DNA-binding NtrC family response regulator